MIRIIFITVGVVLAVWAATHAILRRRDPRAALWWVGVTLAVPIAGALLYYLFGINRIHRKPLLKPVHNDRILYSPPLSTERDLPVPRHLFRLADLVDRVAGTPILHGNDITILKTAESAYTSMLQAIDRAKETVGLDIYIFNDDAAGRPFIEALSKAVQRGVEVCVLLDDVGSRYSGNSAFKALREKGVPVAYFMPSFNPLRLRYLNLRNHRKILTVDGRVGYTGGMNIHGSHLTTSGARMARDLHFKVEGPAVTQLQETFQSDWLFTTGQSLDNEKWFPRIYKVGRTAVRGITDGPDHDFEKGRWTITGALGLAQKSIQIVTPYFVPDGILISELGLAALKGVRVDIILPVLNDLPLVHWASRATLWQVLERGCHIWFSPPPFDHSKIMTVDRGWALVGSSNWDTRSFRLNFEFNMECYDRALAGELADIVDEKRANSREVTLAEMDSRGIPVKIRDGIARLFAPHL